MFSNGKVLRVRECTYIALFALILLINVWHSSMPWFGYSLVLGSRFYVPESMLSVGYWATVLFYAKGILYSLLLPGFLASVMRDRTSLFQDRPALSSTLVLEVLFIVVLIGAGGFAALIEPSLLGFLINPVAYAITGIVAVIINLMF